MGGGCFGVNVLIIDFMGRERGGSDAEEAFIVPKCLLLVRVRYYLPSVFRTFDILSLLSYIIYAI